jgi:hypothetical protein
MFALPTGGGGVKDGGENDRPESLPAAARGLCTSVSPAATATARRNAAAAAAAAEVEMQSARRVIARWLNFHAPLAKQVLVTCLRPLSSPLASRTQREQEAEAAVGLLRVNVESVGSGIILIRGLQLMRGDTLGTVIQKAVRGMVAANPTATVTDLRVFNGHVRTRVLRP